MNRPNRVMSGRPRRRRVPLVRPLGGDERREMNAMDSYYDDNQSGSASGWPEFAAVLLFAVGFFRIISAIGYFADSRKIDDLHGGLFSSQIWAWGLWDLGIAALAIFAGISL